MSSIGNSSHPRDDGGLEPVPSTVTRGVVGSVQQRAADLWVLEGLGRPTLAIGIVYLIVAAIQGISSAPWPMPAAGFVLGILCIILGTVLIRRHFEPRQVHPWAFATALLAVLNGALHIRLTGEPQHTVELVLAVVAAGVVLLDAGWLALVIATAFCAWLFAIPDGALSDDWMHYGLTLVGSAMLAGLALHSRHALFRHMAAVRQEERLREVEVHSALDRAETAREGEEEARLAVEFAVRQLKESEERFRRLAEASFEGVIIHQGGRMVDANRHASEMFGYSLSEFLQRRVELLAAPESREAMEAILEISEGQKPGSGPRGIEVTGVRANGSKFPVELAVASVLHSGEPASVLVVRDVTARKQIEEMLRQIAEEAEESSRAKSAFLANMSHELRTPLNAVIGFANVLRRNRDGDANDRESVFLDRIASNGRHLLTLINDVLDLSKIEAGRMEMEVESIDVLPFVEDVVQSLELSRPATKGPTLCIEVPPLLDPVMADRQRLRQVLLNLVGNALKFTEEGTVTIRVVANDRQAHTIQVEDTGIGIPPDRMPHIFSPFRQVDSSTSRRYGGTGLGLTISRSLCEMMGFALEGESELGCGSTFRIELAPCEREDATEEAGQLRAG